MKNRIATATPVGVQFNYVNEWPYCKWCGFCHANNYKKCLKPRATNKK